MISILYVDDEPGLRELCRIFLERTGEFRVDTVESGEAALRELQNRQYDAVISDYQMPVMDGISLLKAIRKQAGDLPFILFTGRGREDVVIEAVNNGVDFYLRKGGDPTAQFAELMHKVRLAVNTNQAEKELRAQYEALASAEAEARKKEYQLRQITANIPGVVFQILADYNDRLTAIYLSERSRELFSVDRSPLGGAVERFTGVVHPEDRQGFLDSISLAVKNKERWNFEGRLVKPSQELIWFQAAASPVETDKGLVYSGVIFDITSRKQAEEALRHSEGQYRSIIDNMQDMFYRTDLDGKITMVNPSGARMAGYGSPEEMIGIDVARDMYADPQQRKKFLTLLSKKGSVTGYPVLLKTRDGRRYHATASSHYFYDTQGKVAGIEGLIHDVTDLRQAEAALREANRKLNLLNSITRHDVANQLTVLQGYAQLAMIKNPDPMTGDFLQKIGSVAGTIARQIDFSKTYQELGVHEPGWFSLDEILAKTRPKDILFSSSCTGIEIFADPMLEKVFANLFGNSVMHGEHVSRISVRCDPAGDDLMVTVEDNGVGIPLDEKQKIFKKGFGKNTGFGLFLAREILAITDISIHETGKHGRGARFEITVPKGGFRSAGET